jgi:hypothetical protein
MSMGARRFLLLLLCIGLLGCGGTTASARPTSQAVIATASPVVTLTPNPLVTPVAPTPSPRAKATPKPTPTWTELERAIFDAIRYDAQVDCAPRRRDNPRGTIAAVECRPGKAPVSRVAFYLFATAGDAFHVYTQRIQDAGLELVFSDPVGWEHAVAGGACDPAEVEAEEGESGTDAGTCPDREAAFLNSDGYANYRAVNGRIYIGALGTNSDINALAGWAHLDGRTSGHDMETLWCTGSRPAAGLPLCS